MIPTDIEGRPRLLAILQQVDETVLDGHALRRQGDLAHAAAAFHHAGDLLSEAHALRSRAVGPASPSTQNSEDNR